MQLVGAGPTLRGSFSSLEILIHGSVRKAGLELLDTPDIIIRSKVINITELTKILDGMGEGDEE